MENVFLENSLWFEFNSLFHYLIIISIMEAAPEIPPTTTEESS